MDIGSLKNNVDAARQTLESIKENQIKGMDMGDFIFNKIITRLDPVEYIERVLRAHLPEEKRHLHENQKELVRAVCNPKIRKVAALMSRQSGKCFAKGTKIMMSDGSSKQVENINIDDYVMGPNSEAIKVSVTSSGIEKMYKIVPLDDYTPFVVNESHILSLKNIVTNNIINITVKDYLKLPDNKRKELKGYRAKVNFNHTNIYFDPYTAGKLGIYNQLEQCVRNDEHVRYEALAGMIDNAIVEENHGRLILKVHTYGEYKAALCILRTLGFNAYQIHDIANEDLFNISFYGDFKQIPVRKKAWIKYDRNFHKTDTEKLKEDFGDYTLFDFEVIYTGVYDYYGFVLEGNEHRFLLYDCTVTHNTESIASFTGFLLDNYPNMRIGIFTPRIQQAEVSLGRISVFFQMNEERLNNKIISCTKQKIKLSNNSYVSAVSASDQSNIEGLTFDVIILDEAQKVTDYTWSERIVPMGGGTNAKLIKIGTPKSRNHFYECIDGSASSEWTVIRRDWTQCPQLWALDKIMLPDYLDKTHTKLRPYSRFVFNLMPKSLKQWYFPTRPDVWTEGDMSVEDFKTQYMLEFVDGAGQFLSTEERDKLINGDFEWLHHGRIGEKYVAGIDFAGSSSDNADFTHITVLRIDRNNQKQKVYAEEMQGMSYPEQIRHIVRLLGGPNPKFNCSAIFADFTGCGRPVVQTLKEEYGLTQLTGITFNGSDTFTHSGMNLKNAMYANAKQEIDYDRFKYPTKDNFIKIMGPEKNGFYHKMIGEWSDLECEQKLSVNKRIEAPAGGHDDCPSADVLAVFAAIQGTARRAPMPVRYRTSRY